MTPQLRWGWYGSISIHLLLLLLALLLRLPQIVKPPDFVDISWMTLSSPSGSAAPTSPALKPASAAATPNPASAVRQKTEKPAARPQRTINLPERRGIDPSDDRIIVSRRAEKSERDPAEDPLAPPVERPLLKNEASTIGPGTPSGRGIERTGSGLPGSTVGSGVGGPGLTGAGSGVGFDVQWSGDGGVRSKISGELPKYPEGTNVAAQVRIEAVVLPDGSIRSVKPIQKANTALEDAAMKALSLWRFEPLSAKNPQVDQSCVVTFLFKLR